MSSAYIKRVVVADDANNNNNNSINNKTDHGQIESNYLTIFLNGIMLLMNTFMDFTEYIIVYGKKSRENTIQIISYFIIFIIFVFYLMTKIRVFK
jgi:hypothetical protein